MKILLILLLSLSSVLHSSEIIGVITNTAKATYSIGVVAIQQTSIPIKLNIVRSDEKVEFLKVISEERVDKTTILNNNTKLYASRKILKYIMAHYSANNIHILNYCFLQNGLSIQTCADCFVCILRNAVIANNRYAHMLYP